MSNKDATGLLLGYSIENEEFATKTRKHEKAKEEFGDICGLSSSKPIPLFPFFVFSPFRAFVIPQQQC